MSLDPSTLRQHLVGTWLLCGAQSLFGSGTADAGLQVNADGTWVRLGIAIGGGLVMLTGPEDGGTWSVPTPAVTPTASPSLEVVFSPRVPSASASMASAMLAPGPPQRVRFTEGGIPADYRQTNLPVSAGPASR